MFVLAIRALYQLSLLTIHVCFLGFLVKTRQDLSLWVECGVVFDEVVT